MRLDHEFNVPAPVGEVWQAVLDPERVAPCMPGATLTEVDGDTFRGSVKVKLGPVNLLYKGSGEFQDKDEQARKLVIKASGKDARGAGTAAATVTVTLTADGANATKGAVATDLNVTGKPAQFGRGMISEVGGKILDAFAENLSAELAGTAAAAAAEVGAAGSRSGSAEVPTTTEPPKSEQPNPEQPNPEPHLRAVPERKEGEAIDLLDFAGGSVAKRIVPVAAGFVALTALFVILKRLRAKRVCASSQEDGK